MYVYVCHNTTLGFIRTVCMLACVCVHVCRNTSLGFIRTVCMLACVCVHVCRNTTLGLSVQYVCMHVYAYVCVAILHWVYPYGMYVLSVQYVC
jgi:hypothetical protein